MQTNRQNILTIIIGDQFLEPPPPCCLQSQTAPAPWTTTMAEGRGTSRTSSSARLTHLGVTVGAATGAYHGIPLYLLEWPSTYNKDTVESTTYCSTSSPTTAVTKSTRPRIRWFLRTLEKFPLDLQTAFRGGHSVSLLWHPGGFWQVFSH